MSWSLQRGTRRSLLPLPTPSWAKFREGRWAIEIPNSFKEPRTYVKPLKLIRPQSPLSPAWWEAVEQKLLGGYQGRKGLYQYSWIFSILPRKAKEWQRRSQTPRASSEQSGWNSTATYTHHWLEARWECGHIGACQCWQAITHPAPPAPLQSD